VPAAGAVVANEVGASPTACYATVAVPLPLPSALTYLLPPGAETAAPGMRVRVQVGRRRLVGVITGVSAAPPGDLPTGTELRSIDAVVDAEPVLSTELLALASFTADYYLAPPGEVVRAMLPAALAPWGDRDYWLTDGGALATPRDPVEAAIVGALRRLGRASGGALRGEVEPTLGPALPATLDRMRREGRLAAADDLRGTGRYRSAVELGAGSVAEQRRAAGRSPAALAVIDHLAVLGRPATVEEVRDAVGCGDAVVRRLVKLGVLRRFTQVASHRLERHRLAGQEQVAVTLRADQATALGAVVASLDAGCYAAFALQGMTGAGKTEVYLQAVAAALDRGRGALVLVPEIALVPALAREVTARFPGDCAILHSNLGTAERQQEWERVRAGAVRVVVGPRSAIFAPLANLGLVVVDEEQDTAYKQELTPRYSGRDLALVRGSLAGATVLLVSATPSLETRANVERGKLGLLVLSQRFGQGSLPTGILVDLREERSSAADAARPSSFSARLREELATTLAAGDQVILFRNRRGYAPILLCRACGEDLRCDDCGLPRTWHRRDGRLLCHYCGSTRPVPAACPACGEAALEPVGAGTERVEEELAELHPGVAVDVLDRDAVRRVGGPTAVLERFGRGETQVLIGTQMVSKGHHFPNVALAAVLSADTYLSFPDFRAVERTYTLLVQLAGRAGRGERPGKVVVQTHHPDHYAIRAALANDDAGFAAEELRFRRVFHYPPYTRMAQLLWADRQRLRGEQAMRDLAERLRRASGGSSRIRLAGPAPAPLERLRGEWRFQILVRAPTSGELRQVLRAALPDGPPRELVVDIDPQSLL
jgi:primosomal protein N' (replication factor Y)